MNANSKSMHATQPSRREFLKTSSAMALATGLAISRSAHAAGSDTIRIALVGCGGRGAGAAYNALTAHSGVKLVALADAFREPLERSYRALLESEHKGRIDVPDDRKFVGLDAYQRAIACDVDMVLLCTPPGFRPDQYRAAVDAGLVVGLQE